MIFLPNGPCSSPWMNRMVCSWLGEERTLGPVVGQIGAASIHRMKGREMTASSDGNASRVAPIWPVAVVVLAVLLTLAGPFLGLLASALGAALLVLVLARRRRWGAWFVPLVVLSVVVILAGGVGLLLGLDLGGTELQMDPVQTEGSAPR